MNQQQQKQQTNQYLLSDELFFSLMTQLNDFVKNEHQRNGVENQVAGFDIRSKLKCIRMKHGVNNATIYSNLPPRDAEIMKEILSRDFVNYDSGWLLPNKNTSPQRVIPRQKFQKTPSPTKREVQAKLSIQQQRKLKRNLFGSTLRSGVEYQGLKPDVMVKGEQCLDEIGNLAKDIRAVMTANVSVSGQTMPLKQAVIDAVGKVSSLTSETTDGLTDMMLATSKLFEQFKFDDDPKVNVAKAVEAFYTKIMGLSETTSEFSSSVKGTISAIVNAIQAFSAGGLLILFIVCIVKYMQYRDKKYIFIGVASAVMLHKVASSWFRLSYGDIINYFQAKVVPQFEVPYVGAASLLLTLFHVGTADKGKLDKVVNYLTTAERRTSNLQEMVDWSRDLIYMMLNFCLSKFGYDKIYNFRSGESMEGDTIFEKYERILRKIDEDKFVMDSAQYNEIMDLSNACMSFLTVTRENSKNKGLIRQISLIYTFCVGKRKEMADAHWQHVGYRPEPVALVLVGDAGVGKTQSVEYICSQFCSRTLPASEIPRLMREKTTPYVHHRQDENGFWEGYKYSNIITVFDDLGQRRTAVGEDDAFHNLIRAINSFPYQLHMAEMAKKENTMFGSRLIIATSNMFKFEPISLYSMDAINRRLRFKFQVIVNEKYRSPNGEIDRTTLPVGEDGVQFYDPRIVNSYISVDDVGKPMMRHGRTVHTFDQLMDMTIEQCGVNERLRDAKEKNVTKMMMEILSHRQRLGEEIFMDPIEQQNGKTPHLDTLDENAWEWWEEEGSKKVSKKAYEKFTRNSPIRDTENRHERMIFSLYVNHLAGQNIATLDTLPCNPMNEIYSDWVKQRENRNVFQMVKDWFKEQFNPVLGQIIDFACLPFSMIGGLVKLYDSYAEDMGLPSFNKLFFGGMLAGAVGMTTYKTLKWFTDNDKEVDLNKISMDHADYWEKKVSPESYKMRTVNTRSKYKRIPLKTGIRVQGSSPSEDLFNLVQKNLYSMYTTRGCLDVSEFAVDKLKTLWQDKNKMIFSGTITFVKERAAIMPFHFISRIIDLVDEDAEMASQMAIFVPMGCETTKIISVTYKDLIAGLCVMPEMNEEETIFNGDWTIVDFPRHIPCHRDITKHFSQDCKIKNPDVVLVAIMEGVVSYVHGAAFLMSPDESCLVAAEGAPATNLTFGYCYKGETKNGHCGSPLLVYDQGRSNPKIGGIHIAGSPARGIGFSQGIKKSEIMNVLNMLKSDVASENQEQQDVSGARIAGVVSQGNFEMIRKAKPHNPYGNSKLYRSGMHPDNMESYTHSTLLPARLKRKDVLEEDPYIKSLTAYCCNPNASITDPVFEIAATEVENHFLSKKEDTRVFTYEEAVLGIPGTSFGSISRSTSAGYPYNVLGINKKKIFGKEQTYNMETPEAIQVQMEVEDTIEKAARGIRSVHIYTDNLKDETLPEMKVKAGKTRIFCGAPIVYTICCRMYFGHFMKYIQDQNHDLGTAIGVNPFGIDWDLIAKKLLVKAGSSKSKAFGAGDYSRYDGSEIGFIHWRIFDMINRYYGDDGNQEIRRVLWLDLVNSVHISEDIVYEWRSSLPSGHPMTSIVNSMYNHIAMAFCYYSIQKELGYIEPMSFYGRVYLIVMGDDNLFAVNGEAAYFTEENIATHMRKLGLKYTSDTKDGVNVQLREMIEVSFLKRHFRRDYTVPLAGLYGMWVAPLDIDTILQIPFWYRKSIEPQREIVRTNVETVLKELSLHGEDVYNLWADKIVEAFGLLIRRAGRKPKSDGKTQQWFDQPYLIAQTEDPQMEVSKTISMETSFGDTGGMSTTMGHTETEAKVTVPYDQGIHYNDEGGDIKDFLSRPKLLASYSIANTDTATTYTDINIHERVLVDYKPKLLGKYAMAYDIVLDVEVSADRFHSGRYIVYYIPSFYYGKLAINNWRVSHAATLTQITQLQHVEIDVAVDKSVRLTIPWRFINPFIELVQPSATGVFDRPDYGHIRMVPYYPLTFGSSGAPTATLNVWYSLKNVKFYGTADYQSGTADNELKSVGSGPISGPLSTITGVLRGAGQVPMIGKYAKPASWVTEALARTAKHFGFSSPAIQSGVTPFYNAPLSYTALTDVPRPVQTLAATVSNAVSVDPKHSGAKIDEMSIDYLKGIYAYKSTQAWTTTDARDTVLFNVPVNPLQPLNSTVITASGGGTSTLYHHNPAGYIASRFKRWRGSMKYRLKLVKTEFHTGKILVCWHPNNAAVQQDVPPPSVDNTYYRYRQVIDISRGNEFEFVVPYISTRPWKNVLPQTWDAGGYGTADYANGYFSVLVLDQLRAPDTVAQSIQFLLEVAGGEDFKLSGPYAAPVVSTDAFAFQNKPAYCFTAVYQAVPENQVITSYSFGEHPPMGDSTTIDVSLVAGGEQIDSLRKLLKRYTTCFISQPTASVTHFALTMQTLPYISQVSASDYVANYLAYNAQYQDDFAYFGQLFAFFRGSLRFRVNFDPTGPGTGSVARQQHLVTINDYLAVGLTQVSPGVSPVTSPAVITTSPDAASKAFAVSSLSESLEFSIPYYSSDHNIAVQTTSNTIAGGPTISSAKPGAMCTMANYRILSPTALTLTTRFERSIGEDASFAYFVSCPPVLDPRLTLTV